MIYETTLIISSSGEAENVFSLWEAILKDVKKIGATIEKEVKPFERKLAYSIKKAPVSGRIYLGTLYLAFTDTPAQTLPLLEEKLKGRAEIVRFMIARLMHVPERQQKKQQVASTVERHSPKQSSPEKEKPSIQNLDEKIEEILEDKIKF